MNIDNKIKNGKYKEKYGIVSWYKDNLLHREDGPASISKNSEEERWYNWYKAWYFHGKCHREGEPAIEKQDGSKEYWFLDKKHRLDGPAIDHASGLKEWWIEGKRFTEEEFNQYVPRKQFNDFLQLGLDVKSTDTIKLKI